VDATRSAGAPTPQAGQRDEVPPGSHEALSVSPQRGAAQGAGPWAPSGMPWSSAPSGTPFGSPRMPPVARGRDGKDTLLSAPWFEERAAPRVSLEPSPQPQPPPPGRPGIASAVALGGVSMFVTFAAVVAWFALG
jgi:hypothetical protein